MSGRLFVPVVLGMSLSAGLLAQPAISFEGEAVVAQGLSPGGQAVLFGMAREPQGFHTRVVRRQQLVLADAAGEARLELGQPVPTRSVWFVADLSSGAFRIAAPQGSPAKEIAFPAGGLEAAAAGRSGRLRSGIGFIEVLYVRPGRGVWGLTVGDGAQDDDDGVSDRSAAAALNRLIPVASSPPPPTDFAAGDIVVVIDPRGLEFYVAQLPASGLGR